MEKVYIGKTGLVVSRTGFGALPIQRISEKEAVSLLRKAYDNGIDFYDTARSYSDSEEKIGAALSGVRQKVIIATKTAAKTKDDLFKDLAVSLKKLKTDYVDILQLHNPDTLPDPADPKSSYSGLLEARKKGLVRYLGLTNHKLELATEAVRSCLYDTVQFPLNTLSSESELEIIKICKNADCGLIAMKAMSGGLIKNASSAFAFLRQFDNVIPVWGIQKEAELDEFLYYEKEPPCLNDMMWQIIQNDRKELAGQFCRGCGYCMPCSAGIDIPWAARMSLLLRRAPSQNFNNSYWKEKMETIKNCTECGNCKQKCPYNLNIPELLKENLEDYERFFR
ncbi:MAG: aldo/keto reductase [Fibrobacter sp.]|nr:aldo/keto reductase [Fibrobacter sp.]